MPIPLAERSFRKGLAALTDGDSAAAVSHFQSAMLIERQQGISHPRMRYLSYYGMSLARNGRSMTAAVQACEAAVRRDCFDPDLYLNLGRVYALAGKTTRALAAFEHGLAMAPTHAALAAAVSKHERRHAPPLRFLARAHAVNKLLGQLRAAFGGRRSRGVEGFRAASL